MKKLAKVLMVAVPAFVLAACSSSNNNETANGALNANGANSALNGGVAGGQYGGLSAQDLQTRYNTIYFGFDSYSVDGEYSNLLDAHAAYLLANPSQNVVIEGHADERGTPEYNIALGQLRAEAVQTHLVNKGVKGQARSVSYGEEKPAVLGHTEADYAKNRRAVLAY
ncbi:peptidoglycan-associated lipoprotein [Haemophilus paracuniculus]|uniref:Peptidoglycan-associated lipoprotein n=1 Tax=Haemophilus paracuniculus TaxID=734 RepID=A0A1T0ARC3_9PAST|nr:peptidoglycan-associated lipoprotein Pal [Haemophilus paracuniculus]OOR98709.1 peptidoglycan-associated lipoprotein [Haemophilus paracuniculus]